MLACLERGRKRHLEQKGDRMAGQNAKRRPTRDMQKRNAPTRDCLLDAKKKKKVGHGGRACRFLPILSSDASHQPEAKVTVVE